MPIPIFKKNIGAEASWLMHELAINSNPKQQRNLVKILLGDDILESDSVQLGQYLSKAEADESAEIVHQAVLYKTAHTEKYDFGELFRMGLIVALDKVPIGYIANQFLATKTVRRSSGKHPLIAGGFYRVSNKLLNKIPDVENEWLILNVSQLEVEPLRMSKFGDPNLRPERLRSTYNFSKRIDQIMSKASKVLNGKPLKNYILL